MVQGNSCAQVKVYLRESEGEKRWRKVPDVAMQPRLVSRAELATPGALSSRPSKSYESYNTYNPHVSYTIPYHSTTSNHHHYASPSSGSSFLFYVYTHI